MSIKCGFFNSVNGDRRYDAMDVGKLFTGLINDGIFASIGDAFTVTVKSGNTVNVGVGKGWFNDTWIENDDEYEIDCESIGTVLSRYDAIVIKIDSSISVRTNTIEVIHGTESTNPTKPVLEDSTYVHYHPICYIYRPANSTEITQSNITNVVGTETPFVTGIVDLLDLATILKQWEAQLDEFIAEGDAEVDTFIANKTGEYNTWYANQKSLMASFKTELEGWISDRQTTFDEWFTSIKTLMSDDAVANIALRLDQTDVEHILVNGLADGQKTFSDDGAEIVTTNPEGLTLRKVFTNNFLTCTTTLTNSEGVVLGTLVKEFAADGSTINSTITNYYSVAE